jgi:hypothetical protein
MRILTTGAGLGLALFLTASSEAQSITTLVIEGDVIPGLGTVTSIWNLDVNNNGDWVVEIDTDNPSTDDDNAIIQNGTLVYTENQGLATPPGSFLVTFDSMALNEANVFTSNWGLDGTAGSSDDSGLYYNGTLLIQEGANSTAAGFSAGTPYRGFFETYNSDNNQFVVLASVDDPAIASTVDRALVLIAHDGAGALVSETVVIKEGDQPLPGRFVTEIQTGQHDVDFSQAGHVAYILDIDGATTDDTLIYVDGTLIAQEGSPSGVVPGVNWSSGLSSAVLDVNNNGQLLFHGDLDTGGTADDRVIVFDGTIIAREGFGHPAIPVGTVFTSFGSSGPMYCSDNGDVVFYGDWDDVDTTIDTGLFVNDELVVQEGVTMINGLVVDDVRGISDGFRMSDDGRYVVFEAVLAGGLEGAFLLDRGTDAITICEGDGSVVACPCGNESTPGAGEGCRNSQGHGAILSVTGSLSVSAGSAVFSATQARPLQPGMLVQGATLVQVPFKDGILCTGNPTERVEIAFTNANGDAMTTGNIPALGNVSPGDTRHYQYWYRDPALSPCGSGSNFSQGLTILWE